MKKECLKFCRYAGGVLAVCLITTASWAQTPTFGMSASAAIDEIVSPPSQGVQNTGAGIRAGLWWSYDGNSSNCKFRLDQLLNPCTLQPYPNEKGGVNYFEGFCWDGSNPGFSWRLREPQLIADFIAAHINDPTPPPPPPIGTGTRKIEIIRKFSPGGNPNALITNPDIAVATQAQVNPFILDAQQNLVPVHDPRGMGDFYLVAAYEFNGGVYLRIDLIRNPISYGTTPTGAQTDYQDFTIVGDVRLGEGRNPNVDTSLGSEFAVTYEGMNTTAGNIYGVIGKLYTSPLFTTSTNPMGGNAPSVRPSIDNSYNLQTNSPQLFIAGYPTPFRVETGTSDPASEPDVSLTDWFNNTPTPYPSESRAFFTYRTVNTTATNYRIGVTAATIPTSNSLPTFSVDEMPCNACSAYPLHWPRIVSGLKQVTTNPQNYVVVFSEDRPGALGCEGEPGRSIIRTIAHDYAVPGGPIINGFGPPRTHVNQCFTATSDGVSQKPVIATHSFLVNPITQKAGSCVILWQYDKDAASPPLAASNASLSGSDIISHPIYQPIGFAEPNVAPFTNIGTHVRVNGGRGAGAAEAGDQIAPSIACEGYNRVLTAWFDKYNDLNVLRAHDEALGLLVGDYYRPAPPSDPAAPAEPADFLSDATSTSALQVVPNPTGQSGSLDIHLTKGEHMVTIELTDMNSGRVVSLVKAGSLPAELLKGTTLHVPLQKLGAANLVAGYYVVKVTTNRTVHTTRLAYESPERKN
jgi:hypothetical protein